MKQKNDEPTLERVATFGQFLLTEENPFNDNVHSNMIDTHGRRRPIPFYHFASSEIKQEKGEKRKIDKTIKVGKSFGGSCGNFERVSTIFSGVGSVLVEGCGYPGISDSKFRGFVSKYR